MDDRYLIYRLLGEKVETRIPLRYGTRHVCGVVNKMWRDIFSGTVVFCVNGSKYQVKEPAAVSVSDDEVVFQYGCTEDMADEELFQRAQLSAVRGNIHDVLRRTEPQKVSEMRFRIRPRHRRRRRRTTVAIS